MILRTVRRAFLILLLLAGCGLAVPGSPAYLPSLVRHYTHYSDGHSLGYWLRALDRPDPAVRQQALFALGAIGPDAAEAVPPLIRILTEDPDPEPRYQAALALAKMVPASAPAVPALARALDEDPEPIVRMNAAMALLDLGANSRPAVPALQRALQRRANRTNLDSFFLTIQEVAGLALGRATAGTTDAVPALREALRGARTPAKRRALAMALGEVGPSAQDAEPDLRTLLNDNDEKPAVRQAAQDALQKIAPG